MLAKKKGETQSIRNSIQIWYEGDAGASLELDVNIWRIKKRFRKIYIDFGLHIKEVEKVHYIHIYFPFEVQKEDIIDLGNQFTEAKMLKGVFNENYIPDVENKNIVVKDAKTNKSLFSIYQIDIKQDVKLVKKYDGVVISWEVKKYKVEEKYFRFRITPQKYGTFVEHYRPKNSFFESAFVETELLDFRINEKRNQNMSLIEDITEHQQFNLQNINFFITTPIQEEVVSDGTNLVYKRQLEAGDFWKEYLGQSYERMSVYKYNNTSNSDEIDSFSIFSKIKYRKSNFLSIFKYLLVLCAITVLFNTISNCIWHYIEPKEWRVDENEEDDISGTK